MIQGCAPEKQSRGGISGGEGRLPVPAKGEGWAQGPALLPLEGGEAGWVSLRGWRLGVRAPRSNPHSIFLHRPAGHPVVPQAPSVVHYPWGEAGQNQPNQGHGGTEHRQLQTVERIREPGALKGDSPGQRPGLEEGDVVVMGSGEVPGFPEQGSFLPYQFY